MHIRSPRTILALSAALALTVSAAGSTAVMAKGPGGGSSECDGDCTAEQPQAQQQVRARDGSGANDVTEPQRTRARDTSSTSRQTSTRANAGGGGKVQARAANENDGGGRNANQRANQRANQAAAQNTNGAGRNAKEGAGKGPNEDGERGPGTCDECDVEMGTLTDEQAAGVVFMANEEKLAHDVYSAFAEMFGVPIFSNIAASEARHQEAVTMVLARYGLEDTAIDLPAGEFSDPVIASLYDQLIEQGSASLEEAIAVGVLIEETDIADLESRLADLGGTASDESTDDTATLDEEVVAVGAPDVVEMYSHLLAGSRNHLSAFQGWQ